MVEIEAAHQHQLYYTQISMAHMSRSVGGPNIVPTTISTMTQSQALPTIPACVAAGYMTHTTPPTTMVNTKTHYIRRSHTDLEQHTQSCPASAHCTLPPVLYQLMQVDTSNKTITCSTIRKYVTPVAILCLFDIPMYHTP